MQRSLGFNAVLLKLLNIKPWFSEVKTHYSKLGEPSEVPAKAPGACSSRI